MSFNNNIEEEFIDKEKNNIKEVLIEEENNTNEIHNWDDLHINDDLLRGIYAYGFEKPSYIQQRAIEPIINGKDIIAQAQSGTGKTATFTIGALAGINLLNNNTQVLVLSPTKELTIQTTLVFSSLGCMMNGLRIQSLYGGSIIEDNSSIFSNKNIPHIICGCPGKVNDMLRREKINASTIKLIILDEADEMLSYGFKEQVYNIFQFLNQDIQVALFSATIPNSITPIIDTIMRNPIKITVKREMLTLEGIQQYYVAVDDDREKYLTLKNLFTFLSVSQCIIYANSVKRVEDLYYAMKEDEFPVCHMHSNMEKNERENAFNDFKNGKSRVLISSNVTARGIDIQQVSIIINFDLPKCVDTYLHRIGRGGRWGRKGVGINLITKRDIEKMREIEQHYCTQINELPSNIEFLTKI
jgi:superfamily II DNA/RNA helicase